MSALTDTVADIAAPETASLWFFSLALERAGETGEDTLSLPYDEAMDATRRTFDTAIPAAIAEAGEGIVAAHARLFYGPGLRRTRGDARPTVIPVANLHVPATPDGAARLADALLRSLHLREVVYYRRAAQK